MRIRAAGLFLRSCLLQAGFSAQRRQALGFAWALDPVLRAAWIGDAGRLARARARALGSFNVNPYASGVVLGTAAALEDRAALGEPALAARADALKQAMGASLSGAADALFWGALRPLSAALAVIAALAAERAGLAHPLAAAAAAGLLVFNAPALAARWLGIARGLADGERAASAVAALPAQAWIRAARLAASAAVLGAAGLALCDRRLPAPRALAAAAFAVGAARAAVERAR